MSNRPQPLPLTSSTAKVLTDATKKMEFETYYYNKLNSIVINNYETLDDKINSKVTTLNARIDGVNRARVYDKRTDLDDAIDDESLIDERDYMPPSDEPDDETYLKILRIGDTFYFKELYTPDVWYSDRTQIWYEKTPIQGATPPVPPAEEEEGVHYTLELMDPQPSESEPQSQEFLAVYGDWEAEKGQKYIFKYQYNFEPIEGSVTSGSSRVFNDALELQTWLALTKGTPDYENDPKHRANLQLGDTLLLKSYDVPDVWYTGDETNDIVNIVESYNDSGEIKTRSIQLKGVLELESKDREPVTPKFQGLLNATTLKYDNDEKTIGLATYLNYDHIGHYFIITTAGSQTLNTGDSEPTELNIDDWLIVTEEIISDTRTIKWSVIPSQIDTSGSGAGSGSGSGSGSDSNPELGSGYEPEVFNWTGTSTINLFPVSNNFIMNKATGYDYLQNLPNNYNVEINLNQLLPSVTWSDYIGQHVKVYITDDLTTQSSNDYNMTLNPIIGEESPKTINQGNSTLKTYANIIMHLIGKGIIVQQYSKILLLCNLTSHLPENPSCYSYFSLIRSNDFPSTGKWEVILNSFTLPINNLRLTII